MNRLFLIAQLQGPLPKQAIKRLRARLTFPGFLLSMYDL
jgi:hypothetical protein